MMVRKKTKAHCRKGVMPVGFGSLKRRCAAPQGAEGGKRLAGAGARPCSDSAEACCSHAPLEDYNQHQAKNFWNHSLGVVAVAMGVPKIGQSGASGASPGDS